MKYSYDADGLIIGVQSLRQAGGLMRDILRHIREANNLPLDKYERQGLLQDADYAQRYVLELAKLLGIDLGAEWGNEIDLRVEYPNVEEGDTT